jgi:hypothetical protein
MTPERLAGLFESNINAANPADFADPTGQRIELLQRD